MIKITVPATSANLGIGYDTLGMAVSLYSHFTFERADKLTITGCPEEFQNENNLVYVSFVDALAAWGEPAFPVAIDIQTDVPVARGLGSSSTCVVAGIMAAAALTGHTVDRAELVRIATEVEGHPDNVAPAMLGGFVTSVIDEGQVYSVKKDIDPELAFAAFVPDFRLLTSKARAALPAMVSHKDAVYNLSRAALATAAFCEGNYALLGVATKDVLHQKYRLPLIEGGDDVFELAQDLGAQAVYISGAGPTIMAVVHKDDTEFFTRAEAALAADSPLRHFTVHRLLADNVGAVVS